MKNSVTCYNGKNYWPKENLKVSVREIEFAKDRYFQYICVYNLAVKCVMRCRYIYGTGLFRIQKIINKLMKINKFLNNEQE